MLSSILGVAILALTGTTIASPANQVRTTSKPGPDKDGKYTIYGNGIRAQFIPYGASVTNLFINSTAGKELDIVLGFDNATYYTTDKSHPHLGGVPGRYANRIKNSTFELDGEKFHILPNDNPTKANPKGVDTLHGGPNGYDWRNWTVVRSTMNSITFSLVDKDGDQGFPGEVISYVTYTLGNMTWDIRMVALATTKKTPIMLSSHAYWNLDGFTNTKEATALDHELWLPYAGERIGTDTILIPNGDIVPNTKGGVNDFWSKPKAFGSSMKDPALAGNCGFNCTGYDTCYLFSRRPEVVGSTPYWLTDLSARLYSPFSGIQLDIFTDQPAFQVYNCPGQNGSLALKKTQGQGVTGRKRTVPKYGCVVMEVQDYIDGINHPEWGREGKQIFGPDTGAYNLNARYQFSLA